MIDFWPWNGEGVWGQLPPQRPSHSLLTSRIHLVHITMISYISVTSSWYIYQSHYHNTVFISIYSILYVHWKFSCFAAGCGGLWPPQRPSSSLLVTSIFHYILLKYHHIYYTNVLQYTIYSSMNVMIISYSFYFYVMVYFVYD